jgi:tRNA threonylcarbamoyl adenosine modification protein (Sua5/YciO/YrdC/YwlC family)
MANLLKINSENPQKRLIKKVVEALHSDAVIIYPTDSGYALGTTIGNKKGIERIKIIRNLKASHHFTLIMRNLSHIGEYAKLNNSAFRLLKKIIPGPYTFILEIMKDVPRKILHEKKKTIGIRVPNNNITQSILEELEYPIMSVSLATDGDDFFDFDNIFDVMKNKVDIIIDGGHCPTRQTTVIDLSGNNINIIRQGLGDTSFIY